MHAASARRCSRRTPHGFGAQGGSLRSTTEDIPDTAGWPPRARPRSGIAALPLGGRVPGRSARLTGPVPTGLNRHLAVRQRRERLWTRALLVLMGATTPQARAEAARFAGRHHALCAPRLPSQTTGAIPTLDPLSTPQPG